MANWKDWRSENVNAIERNCEVAKNVATPPFLHQRPLFRINSPILQKFSYPLPRKWLPQCLEGPTPHPLTFNKGGGGVGSNDESILVLRIWFPPIHYIWQWTYGFEMFAVNAFVRKFLKDFYFTRSVIII